MIIKILKSVEDFQEKISNGTLKTCFLHEGTKVSRKGWNVFVKPEELEDPMHQNDNLGISLLGAEYPGAPILTCIDIDGDKTDKEKEQFTKDFCYNLIKEEFDKRNLKYMAVKSSSGGYHIYINTLTESLRYTSTQGLIYPNNFNSMSENIQMYLSSKQNVFDSLKDTPVPKSIVEVWCSKRYIVAPGSDIYDDEGNYVGTTTLLEDGVQRFGDIGIYKEPLNDLLREIFTSNGFSEDKRLEYIKPLKSNIHTMTSSPQLSDFSIRNIGDLIIEAYQKIPGQKHTATLALGGYFFNKKLSLESVTMLGHYIVDNAPQDLFKNNEAFIDTLTHDIREQDESRLQTGLPTFEDILSPFYSKEYIGKKLHLATNPAFHKFWPDGRYGKKFDEIIINHNQNYITKNIIQTKFDSDGEIIDNVIQNHRIEQSIEGIKKFNDISHPEEVLDWDKPVQVLFKKTNQQAEKSPIYKNPTELFRKYRNLPGVYTDHAKSIIESIYREYELLDYIEEEKTSTRPGIFYDTEEGQLKKYIKENQQIVYVEPQKPSKEDLVSSLELLQKINDIYPWQEGKFGFFVKTVLTMPYADILKYHFEKYHPCIILYGEAGTLKSTAGELAISFNLNHKTQSEGNIMSGGELFSEYRFGRAMDNSSFPLVVNETEYLFSTPRIKELIKDSVTGKLIRKPGGNEPQGYYSHRACIYTMNNLPMTTEDPAFLRRFIPLEFDSTERGDEPETIEKFEFLNENGVKNSKFQELKYIGDFVYYILNENIHWFDFSLEQIQDNIIHELEKYSQMYLGFLKQHSKEFVYMDRQDQQNIKLSILLGILRKPYQYNKNKFFKETSETAIVRQMVNKNVYSFVNKIDDDWILIDIGLKHKFNEETLKNGMSITLKGCYSYFQELDLGLSTITLGPARVKGRKKQIRGIRMSVDDFTKILTNKENPT